MLKDLIKDIRLVLVDPDGNRWKDEDILRLISQGQKLITTKTLCLRSTMNIAYELDRLQYRLPNNLIKLISIGVNNKFYDIDNVSFISYSNNRKELNFIKPLNKLFALEQLAIDQAATGLIVVDDSSFGTENSALGLAEFAPDYMFQVQYYKTSYEVNSVDDILQLDHTYHYLLRHYVCAMLLRADGDSQSRALGNEEYKLFNAGIVELKKESMLDFSTTVYEIKYRRD